MATNNTVPFTPDEVKNYLDRCIRHWRRKKQEGDPLATYYVDAFQSVRMSIFGELLPKEQETKKE